VQVGLHVDDARTVSPRAAAPPAAPIMRLHLPGNSLHMLLLGPGAALKRFLPTPAPCAPFHLTAPSLRYRYSLAPPQVDVYTPLSGHLPRLWQLWEMTLLGRALLLVAPTPGETSAGVAALLSLVAPLPYAADFRPYYCIHDTAFSRMASGLLPGPEARDVPTLLGVTNLYFIRVGPRVDGRAGVCALRARRRSLDMGNAGTGVGFRGGVCGLTSRLARRLAMR
jgi:hypothetical protein